MVAHTVYFRISNSFPISHTTQRRSVYLHIVTLKLTLYNDYVVLALNWYEHEQVILVAGTKNLSLLKQWKYAHRHIIHLMYFMEAYTLYASCVDDDREGGDVMIVLTTTSPPLYYALSHWGCKEGKIGSSLFLSEEPFFLPSKPSRGIRAGKALKRKWNRGSLSGKYIQYVILII